MDGEGEEADGAWSGGRGLRVGGSDGTAVLASSMVLGAAGCSGAEVAEWEEGGTRWRGGGAPTRSGDGGDGDDWGGGGAEVGTGGGKEAADWGWVRGREVV